MPPPSHTAITDIRCLAFGPDGARIAGGTAGGRVAVWDRAGHRLGSWKPHRGPVVALAFSPSGHRFASAGYLPTSVADDTIVEALDAVEIDLRTGSSQPLPAPPNWRRTPTARDLVYADEDGLRAILAQDSGFGALVGLWLRRDDRFLPDFTQSSKTPVALRKDGSLAVRVWTPSGIQVVRGERILATWELEDYLRGAAFSRDGGTLAVLAGETLLVGRIQDRPRRFTCACGGGFALSGDGALTAYADRDGEKPVLTVAETRSGRMRRRFPLEGPDVPAFALNADGSALALAGHEGLEVRSVADGGRLFAPPAPAASLAGAVPSADGTALFTAGGHAGKAFLRRTHLADGTTQALPIALAGPVTHMAAGGPQPLALLAGEGGVEVWDLGREAKVGEVAFDGRPTAVAVAPEGDRALVALHGKALEFRPAAGPEPLQRSWWHDAVSVVCTTGGGLVLGFCTERQELEADPWNPGTSRALHGQVQVGALPPPGDLERARWGARRRVAYHSPSTFTHIAEAPGTDWVVGVEEMVEHTSRATFAWNRRTGEIARCGSGEHLAVLGPTALAVSPDGRLLAEALASRPARLILSGTPGNEGIEPREIAPGERTLTALAFSRDGRLLAGCGDDGIAIVWEVATGREVAAA
jgi:hypothetical protein